MAALETVRLVTYANGATTATGLVDGDLVWNLPDSYAAHLADQRLSASAPAYLPETMKGFIALGGAGIDGALAAVTRLREQGRDQWLGRPLRFALGDVTLLPPVPDPAKILCMGLIFQTHAVATGQELPKQPQIFMKPQTGLVGHGGPLILPKAWPERVVPGTELCVVMGSKVRHVDEEHALDGVYGYTILNDVTARGFPFPKNKMFDSHSPLGPWLVPKAYAPDPQNVSLLIRVNGEEREAAHTRDMTFKVSRQIHDCAEVMTLLPGDLIATGDVGSEAWLKPGDLLEAEVEGIGTLTNRCVAEV